MNLFERLTDMTHPKQIASEMQKKYKDTYLKLHLGNETLYGSYYGIGNTYAEYIFKALKDKELVTIRLTLDHKDNVSIEIPKFLGCYSTKNNLVVIQKLPHRQWKRGICRQNTLLTFPVKVKQQELGNDFNIYFPEVLQEPQDNRTLDEAIHLIASSDTKIGTHITRDFGIILNYTDEEPCYRLFYYNYLVGSVYPDKKEIVVENGIFLQELIDTQTNWANNYRIIYNG